MSPTAKLVACSILVSALTQGIGCSTYRAAMLYQRGTEELNQGEVERALADLERAAELAPNASEVQNHLGLALSAAGRDDEARAAFERAVQLDCSNAAAANNLALVEAGRMPGASGAGPVGTEETRARGDLASE